MNGRPMSQAEWNTVAGSLSYTGHAIGNNATALLSLGHIDALKRLQEIEAQIARATTLCSELKTVLTGAPANG